ncbi:YheC/YheD family protein [Sulfoacidibacillus thermotolerans]|uniref:ATP-grasp domain-containing protein n=1 Tax=Sulfoacidibacillus thermotolerans TaxID=1765684 RepID=A0A2U3D7A9_SULT2|nr:YheC/YheD family protein [Sulfoacidibacillus thermotolerans]PWI57166.1 hypothetical protein BM613_09850 [Sulfoacidibacillus thermotolerans]
MTEAKLIPISKWTKYCILQTQLNLRPYLPETHPFSPSSLMRMLQEHSRVVVKTELGEGGSEVLFIHRRKRGFTLREQAKRAHVRNFRELIDRLPVFVRREPCIVQRYVTLQKMYGRPTDIRMIIQKNERNFFEVTGTFVKVAKPHMLITNVKQGGTIDTLSQYLTHCYPQTEEKVQLIQRELYLVSQRIGDILGTKYKNVLYGIDFGLSQNGHPYILEINTKPSLSILSEIDIAMHKRALELRKFHQSADT